ncbi:glycosyltransferase [Costertonia aggregata]|uniref:Glycosyltransferase n=1 Tax=Costertonia aggregata TaxID=343403 RepID=A0A7H9AKK0_9FLAO|nr:glycosyltransferase [Costertonia aggregata]QLG44001.1 glycosyltransferase [Costertonia aggregata]
MITIIIPAHNERENLLKLVHYIDNPVVASNAEVIISISCDTTDGSENIKVPPYIKLIKCDGRGRATQMNRAAGMAKGNVLVFLHADVQPPKSFLLDIEKTMDGGFEAGFFSYRFDKESFFLKINASFTAKDGIFTGGGDQCLFIQKTLFEALGKFDENQVVMEDFEFFQRMKKNRIKYKIIKNDLVVSARKYENNSYIRVNLSNLLLVVLFKMGYPARKLKSLHDCLIRTPYRNNTQPS